MIKRLSHGEKGMALLLAVAFMSLGLPLVLSGLHLASALTVDSRVKTDILKRQYSALGAQQYALNNLLQQPGATTTSIDLNGMVVITTVVKLLIPPGNLPFYSRKGRRLFTTKEASPTSISANATTTFTLSVRNSHIKKIDFKKVVDELPEGFSYVIGSSSMTDGSGTVISTDDPTTSGQTLEWNVPSGTELQVGETATLTFVATAPSTAGVYCNEAYAEKGGKKTRSGKTAKVTVGSPGQSQCAGLAVSLYKTVDPEVVFSDTETTYTYTVEIVNEGSVDLSVKDIRDLIGTEFAYVPLSSSSTPSSLNPDKEPKIKAKDKDGVTYNEIKWKFGGDPRVVPVGTTWLMEFKATATLPKGFYSNEVELKFEDDDDKPPDRITGPTAIVTVAEVYRITVTVGNTIFECDVWLASDIDIGDYEVVDACAFGS